MFAISGNIVKKYLFYQNIDKFKMIRQEYGLRKMTDLIMMIAAAAFKTQLHKNFYLAESF